MDNLILKLDKPTISVKDLLIWNKNHPDVNLNADTDGVARAGSESPYLAIKDMRFFFSDVQNFSLSTDGFLPTVSVMLRNVNNSLSSDSIPIDDILSVYIASDNSDYNGIRQDYRITSCQSIGNSFHIDAILHVDGLFVDRIEGYKGTVFEYLRKIAKSLKLGFASNIKSTNDNMYHINPNMSYHDFINNELINVCYLDDKSFFKCYIDTNYYLTLVEVNSLVLNEIKVPVGSVVNIIDESTEIKQQQADAIFLSNRPESGLRNTSITSYGISSDAGVSGLINGYLTNITLFDENENMYKKVFIETTTTDGVDSDTIIIKGYEDEDHTKNTRDINVGSLFPDNVHSQYYPAKVSNNYNLNEMNKLMLNVSMLGVDFSLFNYMSIPVEIVIKNQLRVDLDGDNSTSGLNMTLSGMYILSDLKYIYNYQNSEFYMSAIVKKREYIKTKSVEIIATNTQTKLN